MDPLRIIEAGYAWEPSESAWLAKVTDAFVPLAPSGGVVACTLDCSAGATVGSVAMRGAANEADVEAIRAFCRDLPPKLTPSVFAPTEFVGNAGRRLQRLARARGVSVERLAGGTSLPPMWAIVGGDPLGRSVLVSFPDRQPEVASEPFPRQESEVLGMVGAHLGAALRLRAATVPPSADDGETQAVVTPGGAVVHAEGDATAGPMRASLAAAVLRSERARGPLRRVDAAQATRLWMGLVEGRWSIVEVTESDGKRLLLARKNSLKRPDVLALSREESDVVWLVVLGHTNKYVGYELGIATHAVARHLGNALKKLRIPSRRELIRRLRSAP